MFKVLGREYWGYSHNRCSTSTAFPKTLPWDSTLLWRNSFWCHRVILGLVKRKLPRNCKEPEAAPASIQDTPSLSTEPDEAGTIWGLATEVLWVYLHAFNSRGGQWHMEQSHPLRAGDTSAFCCLAHIMVEDSITREGVPPAWQTSTKAAEPIRESQQRKGAGVSCIASERRTDLSTQELSLVHRNHQSFRWPKEAKSSETDIDVCNTTHRKVLDSWFGSNRFSLCRK